jgi:hypothetical protein
MCFKDVSVADGLRFKSIDPRSRETTNCLETQAFPGYGGVPQTKEEICEKPQ